MTRDCHGFESADSRFEERVELLILREVRRGAEFKFPRLFSRFIDPLCDEKHKDIVPLVDGTTEVFQRVYNFIGLIPQITKISGGLGRNRR